MESGRGGDAGRLADEDEAILRAPPVVFRSVSPVLVDTPLAICEVGNSGEAGFAVSRRLVAEEDEAAPRELRCERGDILACLLLRHGSELVLTHLSCDLVIATGARHVEDGCAGDGTDLNQVAHGR